MSRHNAGKDRNVRKIIAALVLSLATFAACAQDKVVYHFDGGLAQATKGLRNIRNHLDTDAKAKIVAVAHAEGVDFLMEGAKTTNNQEFAALVSDLMGRGVTFEICEITLKNRNLKKEQFILGPTFTPSGVVRIANLQAREQYAYIKP
jgi:intracellular sulfur oxidation DsrE/DsrF family protein